jgi:hypothetical protein
VSNDGSTSSDAGGCHVHHDRASIATAEIFAKTSGAIGLPDIHHIGLIVANRERALAGLGEMFTGPAPRMDATFPPAKFRTGIATTTLRLGFVWAGNLLIEVLQPVDDQSLQGQYLKDHGEGIHHFGFIVPSIKAQLEAFGPDLGANILADGTIAGNDLKWMYLDNQMLPGVVIELIERSSAAEQFFQGIYDVTGGQFPA